MKATKAMVRGRGPTITTVSPAEREEQRKASLRRQVEHLKERRAKAEKLAVKDVTN